MSMMTFLLSMDGNYWNWMELPRCCLPKGVGNHPPKKVRLFIFFYFQPKAYRVQVKGTMLKFIGHLTTLAQGLSGQFRYDKRFFKKWVRLQSCSLPQDHLKRLFAISWMTRSKFQGTCQAPPCHSRGRPRWNRSYRTAILHCGAGGFMVILFGISSSMATAITLKKTADEVAIELYWTYRLI